LLVYAATQSGFNLYLVSVCGACGMQTGLIAYTVSTRPSKALIFSGLGHVYTGCIVYGLNSVYVGIVLH